MEAVLTEHSKSFSLFFNLNKEYPFQIFKYESLPLEIWKEILGTEGFYEVSNLGRVKSHDRVIYTNSGRKIFWRGKILRQQVHKFYNKTVDDFVYELSCRFRYQGQRFQFPVHRLVYDRFVSPINFKIDYKLILHRDNDNLNNYAENLYQATVSSKAKKVYQRKRGPILSNFITDEARQNGIVSRFKIVSQYNLKGEKLGLYRSIKDAAEKTNISPSSITAACKRRKIVSAGNYLWSYGNGPMLIDTSFYQLFIEKGKKKIKKTVTQFSSTGKLLNNFSSIKEASNALNISCGIISDCAKQKTKTGSGYIWKYGTLKCDIDVTGFENEIKISMANKPKPVCKICPITQKIIRKYNSISEAAKAVQSKSTSDISKAARNRKSVCKGYLWRAVM